MSAVDEQPLNSDEDGWEALRAHAPDIVILMAADGMIRRASRSVGYCLGRQADELVGQSLTAITHAQDADGLNVFWAGGEPGEHLGLRLRLQASDGSWRAFQSTLVRLRPDPAPGALLIAACEGPQRGPLDRERERPELERRVSQRLEAVGQLAAGIAHEINTPLQFVGDSVTFLREAVDELLTLTELYRETLYTESPIPVERRQAIMRQAEERADVEYLCERIPKAFERTSDGIERVRSIVQAMKRFSHTSTTEVAPADINDALETTLAVSRNEYKYVAEVITNFGKLPPVRCNISELNQVFLNMIINAAQAIEEQVSISGGHGEIRIETRVEGHDAVIEIADDGPGIPAELQDRIYEPFFTTKEVGRGTGQGLALARTTLERHSGSIECVSESGVGTTFTIRLPIEGIAASDAALAGEA